MCTSEHDTRLRYLLGAGIKSVSVIGTKGFWALFSYCDTPMRNPIVKKNRRDLDTALPIGPFPYVTVQEGLGDSEAEAASMVRWLKKDKHYGLMRNLVAHLAGDGVF